MEATQKLPCNALTKGYILVPKQMLEQLIAHSEKPMSDLEAWLTLLTTVNYVDGCYRIGEQVLDWNSERNGLELGAKWTGTRGEMDWNSE